MMIVETLSKNDIIDGIRFKYCYRLLKSEFEMKTDEGEVKGSCYGIEVERQDIVNNNVINIERDSITKISTYRHKVHTLLKLLCDNSVSPVHLVEILGDYVDDYTSDFNESLINTSTC